MNIRSLFLLLLLSGILACKTVQPISVADLDFVEIKAVLFDQQEAWNEGSLEKFMKGYWKSSDLAFIGSKGVTKGWDQTLNNYQKAYKDKAAMGKLSFDILDLRALGPQSCLMIGKYTLTRENDEPSGYFNLIWEKIGGQWFITTDHTSG